VISLFGALGLQTLVAIEQGLAARRTRPPDIPGAVEDVLADPSLTGSQAAAAVRALAAAVQTEGAVKPELPYHNRHHVAEAVLAMGLLCALARLDGLIDPELAVLGIAAMIGHDRGHDGSPPGDGRLERQAAELTRPDLVAAGLAPAARAVVTDVILATDPGRVTANAGRAAGCLPGDPRGPGFDLLCHMANEADVFASLLPSRGWRMGAALAAEWRGGGHARAATVDSFSGRLAFLRLYRRFSPPAEKLGLGRAVAQQVAAFAWGAASPEDGAAALDRLPRRAAYLRYMDALKGVQDGAA
jgi:hypothetical protein